MIRIPLPEADTAVLLSPRWGELGMPGQVALALLLLVPLVLVAWLYRYELRLVPRAVAVVLLASRILLIVLLWCVAGLQPVVARYHIDEQSGRVLIAVDRSGSMDVPDPQRPLVEKLRLARALNIKIDEAVPSATQLDVWIKNLEEGNSEPERSLRDRLGEKIDRLTRSQVADKVLAADGLNLVQTLAAKHPVELMGFHRGSWEESLDDRTHGLPPVGLEKHSGTDLRQPLLRALEKASDRGRLLGVVLLTDGQHNAGPSPLGKARELGERGVPIYPVVLGTRQPPPDVAVREVRAPSNAFKDIDINIDATVQVTGLPAQEIDVEVLQDGKPLKPEQRQRLQHDGRDRQYPVRFLVRLEEIGSHALEVKARPVGKSATEITLENNTLPTVVRVASDKARVLLVDGEARWEYHYLANLLTRDKGVSADRVVFAQPRLGKIAEAELEKIGNPRLKLPAAKEGTADPLMQYDCIIVGDALPEQLPLADRRRLQKFVADRGGTLILVAGKRAMPLEYLKSDLPGEDEPLAKLLPISEPHVLEPNEGFGLALSIEGRLTSFMQLEGDSEQSRERWSSLAPHYWGIVGRPKPGATVLATGWDRKTPPASAPDPAKNKEALILHHHYGFGRVLFVGLDSTWRWRYRTGDAYHHRFWGQVVRWAASDKLLPAGNRFVRFGTRDPVYRQGKEAEILVRLSEEVPLLAAKAVARARLVRVQGDKDETVAQVPLAAGELQPRLLQGQVRDLPPGKYRIELDIPDLKSKLDAPPDAEDQADSKRDANTFTVLPADNGEMLDLAAHWALLESLAAHTKGKVLTPETAGELADLFARQIVRREHREDQKLWQDRPLVWYVLAIFLVALTVEWVGRKWAGLP